MNLKHFNFPEKIYSVFTFAFLFSFFSQASYAIDFPEKILVSNASTKVVYKDELQQGLKNLYESETCPSAKCLSTHDLDKLTSQALKFKSDFDLNLQNSKALQIKWEKDNARGDVMRFSISSLLQRPDSHPSNILSGLLYIPYPVTQKDNFNFSNNKNFDSTYDHLPEKYPGTVMIHRILNEIKTEQIIAQIISAQYRGPVLVIYLPEYGPRKLNDEPFISNDGGTLTTNMLQALLDIRLGYEILKSLNFVDPNNIGLMGISLGGMMALISAGIDPVYDRYMSIVGGGDLAHVMSYKFRKPVEQLSETSRVLKNINWTTDDARKVLSSFDAITWAFNVKNKKIVLINTTDDELLDYHSCILKLSQIYSNQNKNTVELHEFEGGGHNPDFYLIGIKKLFNNILFPIADFFSGKVK